MGVAEGQVRGWQGGAEEGPRMGYVGKMRRLMRVKCFERTGLLGDDYKASGGVGMDWQSVLYKICASMVS